MAFGEPHINEATVGKDTDKVGPKVCKCGKRGAVHDTINYPDYVRRRYVCVCGDRWTTKETVVVEESEEDMSRFNDLIADVAGLAVDEMLIQEIDPADVGAQGRLNAQRAVDNFLLTPTGTGRLFKTFRHNVKLYIVRIE